MSELDSLYSDSDWLDISSGRESDDNVSLSDQDSDRDEISSVPHSRRSSFSTESSLGGDVEAWEGFVSDSGEDAVDAFTGMYPMPPSSPLAAEPVAVGFIPNATEVIDPFVAEEDKRVKEALDQSLVGTLIASRSSAAGVHNSSAHTSIRDLRLSFPDPLTSRDDLNGSYQDVPSSVQDSVVPSAVDIVEPDSESSSPSPTLCDQGSFPTPQVQRNENRTIDPEAGNELDIILYGTSSSIKWQFVQNLIQKAISASGYEFVNNLEDGLPVQSLRFVKSCDGDMSFFESITVFDRTSEDSLKVETDGYTSTRRSLGIIYLPTAELPALNLHDAFLPVLVPSSPKLECDNSVMRQAAEDDWDLLGVPATSTLQLDGGKSPVINGEAITDIKPLRVYELLSNIRDESKKCNPHKPLTEKIKSVNAVTIFGVMSVVIGFALNTMFQVPTPSPTPTVNTPSSSNSQLWQTLAPQPNRSVVGSTGFNQVKDNSISSFEQLTLSIYDSRTAAISVTSPSSISLIVPSTSKAITDSASCSIKTPDSQKASSDVVIRSSETTVSLSTISSSKSIAIISSAVPGATTKDTTFGPAVPNHLKSISEAFDATAKVLTEALGNDFGDLVDVADDILTSFIEHTESVIQQSKGKARALGEQIQNLNEEVVFRNERAKKRAKELKKKGGDIVRAAKVELKERTKRARQRARELRQTVVDNRNNALRGCDKNHEACERVSAEGKKGCKHSRVLDARAEKRSRRHAAGVHWAEYRARRFPF